MAAEGCDLIVTSGGLGPTADDLTAEIVARFAGVELELDERMEAEDRRDHRRLRAADAVRPRGAAGGEPQAGDGPARGRRRSTRPGPPRGWWSPVEDGPVVIVLPGPPRELHAMWDGGDRHPGGPGGARAGRALHRPDAADVRASRVGDRQVAARDRAPRPTSRRSRSRPACAAASSRSTSATAPAPTRYREARRRRAWSSATSASSSALDGSTIDEQVADAASRRAGGSRSASPARQGCSRRGSRTRPAPRATWPAGSSPTPTRRRSTCSGCPAELIERHGAVSPRGRRGDGRRGDRALRRRPRGRDHRDRRPGRRHRGEAGRLRLHLRPARRRPAIARDPVIPGDRADIRDRSCTLALHLVRRLLRGEDFPL